MKSMCKLALAFSFFIFFSHLQGTDCRADLKVYPALTLSEIYDDNIFNAEKDKKSEFISRFMPSLAFDYQGSRIDMKLAYTLDYRLYAKGEQDNETVHFLDTVSLLNWKDRYFLELTDRLSRVSLSTARDFRDESLFQNQTDQNILSLSPYAQFSLSPRNSLRTGYQFVQTTYSGDSTNDSTATNDSTDHILFAEGTHEFTSRTKAQAGYRYLHEDSDLLDHDKNDVWTGLRYEYGENSYVFGTIGYTWIDFSDGMNQNDPYWNAGLSHDFTLLTTTLALGVDYIEDPEGTVQREEYYRVSLARDWPRTRVSASASLSDYYDVDIDELDTRRYGGSGSFYHEFTQRLNGTLTLSGFRYDEEIDDTWTRVLIGSATAAYQLMEDLTASLILYRVDSHSPQVSDDRFETNRVFIELRKDF